jgi:HPt (histidine-containing phosphotransfer) domain-containing protein
MGMSIAPGTLDRMLAESVGGDSKVAAELRALFLASATQHVAALSQAAGVAAWRDEALKLQGLAASFGMVDLMGVAARAADAGPDPLLLDAVAEALADCR